MEALDDIEGSNDATAVESWTRVRTVGLVHRRRKGVMPWDVYIGNIFIGPCGDGEAQEIKEGMYRARRVE